MASHNPNDLSTFNPLIPGTFPPPSLPDPRHVTITPRTTMDVYLVPSPTNGLGGDSSGAPRHKFTDSEAKLLMEWFLEAKYRIAVGHVRQSTRYTLHDIYLGMPTIIICAIAASMAMGTERVADGEVFRYFLCILSVTGTILSFIFANTQFTQRAQQHKNSWTAYTVFANDAEAALARHAAGDRWLHAQQHLDMLYERWKELKGPAFDPDLLPSARQLDLPKTAEYVVRRWQVFAERQLTRHQFAAQQYDRMFFIWRGGWMVVVALCSAASLGTFLPNNTRWPVVFAYCSLILNLFAIIILAFMSFVKYTSLSAQHQVVALKCRSLQDRAGRLLASRPKSGTTSEQLMADAVETLRPMMNDIAVTSPPIPALLRMKMEGIMAPSAVQYASSLRGLQVDVKDILAEQRMEILETEMVLQTGPAITSPAVTSANGDQL